ncbi:hypothetical protein TNCV_819841 [Trichonephila clavipes]|nr:hypothetical protein TNCV_819841 [Trichonephila clavipes]
MTYSIVKKTRKETLGSPRSFTNARDILLQISALYDASKYSIRLCLPLTVTYQGSLLSASQCPLNVAFLNKNQTLTETSTALHLTSTIAMVTCFAASSDEI